MASYFPREFVDRVLENTDIVQVVGEYLPLTKKGRKHWGLCPFHGEKTASFSVDEDKQMYYCFGCHEGGDVFHFLMSIEHMDFGEAVTHLANRANLPLPEVKEEKARESYAYKERLYAALTLAAQTFHATLYRPEGASSLEYLHKRGLDDQIIRRFGLGAAGEGWDNITTVLLKAGYTEKELTDCGISGKRNDRVYDVFRNRAIFPIFNNRGKVIGFGGRALGDAQPKYLNSPESSIFNKRYQLYGLNFIKGRSLPALLLVEGYMDVVSLAQAGVRNAVATLGTALSVDQAKLIKRYAQSVILCYDGDSAGQRAILRCLDICKEANLPCRIRRIPNDMDPDEYVKAYGPQAFEDLGSLSPIQYRLQTAWEKTDASNEEQRLAFAVEASQIISEEKNPVLVEGYVNQLEQMTGIRAQVLYQQIGVSARTQPAEERRRPPVRQNTPSSPDDDVKKAERNILSLFAAGYKPALREVTADDFSDTRLRDVASRILEMAGDPLASSKAVSEIEDEEVRRYVVSVMQGTAADTDEKRAQVLEESLQCLRLSKLEKQIDSLQASLNGLSIDKQLKILKEIQELSAKRASMKVYRKE
ncbi:MAG: DNA primase [Clostridia bacterium]|nr:DNA primase [Clostridia bacterium]